MNILISNDDGVFAPGILAAKQAVEDLANVTVVAPDENNSSVGRRLTLFKHLMGVVHIRFPEAQPIQWLSVRSTLWTPSPIW